jgi:hypothetical protein
MMDALDDGKSSSGGVLDINPREFGVRVINGRGPNL